MAEIKNNFFQGKMNKDLDERLVPNGQYRDALNIEVSTSDDNDVGTVQTVKGNTKVSGSSSVPTGSSIVGEITDEKNNCIYYFVSGPETSPSSFSASSTQPSISKDLILKYDGSANTITNIFTDVYSYLAVFDNTTGDDLSFDVTGKTITLPNTSAYTTNLVENMYVNIFDTDGTNHVWNNRITNVATNVITLEDDITSLTGIVIDKLVLHITHKNEKRALNFDTNYYITGINIIEDFLMWTDNNSEPKKISISRSKAGTTDNNTTTKLGVILKTDGTIDTTHYPLTTDKKVDETHTTVIRKSPLLAPTIDLKTKRSNTLNKTTSSIDVTNFGPSHGQIDIAQFEIENNPFLPNDILLLDTGTPGVNNFQLKIQVLNLIDETFFTAKIISNSTSGNGIFNVFLLDEGKKLFEDKFSFFAIRFKYVDGEYSTFSPFSRAAFLPGIFSYDINSSFNVGMINNIKEIIISNIIPSDIPEDVVQVDILYTESNSPEIYKIDSIRKDSDNDTYWTDNEYIISKENIYALLEEKQLLRQWDNVPKKALAQEIVGNRLVYANYEQNYDLDNQNIDLQAHVDTRIFKGKELIPNPYVSESLQGWDISNAGSFVNTRTKTNNNRTTGSIDLTDVASQYHKFYTTDNILEAEQDARYCFKFTVTNSSGSFVLKGPFLMSGDSSTGYWSAGIEVSSDGDYYGTLTLSNDRASLIGGHGGTSHADHRHIMFQKNDDPNTGGGTGTCSISNFSLKKITTNNLESIKSMRNYKLGVVYSDEYGRETPVLTGKNASIDVPKEKSNNISCIKSKIVSDAPEWATHFKYFVKETSGDYNNLALDRIYRSGDNSFWLSFPSSERNKVTEDDFLILKKAHTSNNSINNEDATYKVLDISANAPDFIKQNKNSVGIAGVNADINNDLFETAGGKPSTGQNIINFQKNAYIVTELNTDLQDVVATKTLAFEFKDNNNRVSQLFTVDSLQVVDSTVTGASSGLDHYQITSETNFTIEDIDWILDATQTSFNAGVTIEFFTVEVTNKPEFDGHFFVKVHEDIELINSVYTNSVNNILDQVVAQSDSYYLNDSANTATLIPNYSTSNTSNFQFGTGATSFTHTFGANDFANADNASSLVVLTEDAGSYDDLFSGDFKATTPFPNLSVNDTLYYEVRPWQESGELVTGTTQVGATSGERNIYKAVSASHMFAFLHVDATTTNTMNVGTNVGGNGIQNNITGIAQSLNNSVGRSKHAAFSYSYGLFQAQTSSTYSVYGSVGAYMKFCRLFKFDQQTTSTGNDVGIAGEFESRWFIDGLSYIGVQNPGSYDPIDGNYRLFHRTVHYEVTNQNTVEMASLDGTGPFGNHPLTARNDFERVARGIYTATSDDVAAETNLYPGQPTFHTAGNFYIQLSYGGFQNEIAPDDFDDASVWETKGWEDPTVDAFTDITQKAKVGAKFRFVDDATGTVFTISKIKKVQRYNHTMMPGDPMPYYVFDPDGSSAIAITWGELRDPVAATNKKFRARTNHDSNTRFSLRTIGSGSTIIQDSITDEEKRFVRGTNRRLTLIMELDKLPGSGANYDPRNETGSAVAGLMDGSNSGRVIQFVDDVVNETTQLTTDSPAVFETQPRTTEGLDVYYEASSFIDIKDHGITNDLDYFNCYSFGNGVESNRIKDVFNKPNLGKGIIASTTLEEVYKKDNRGSGLIFSGIYNSTSNVNNLNQFIQAERITKDVNPTYGSIQKLHTKDSNLLVLCEDKVLKILANKDAVFNADGNPQLTANKNVLGQTIPYVGEFGISKDPRSFAAQSHRAYFTDKQRGAVLRLSSDGLTPISQYGMADFFRDNLPISTTLVGSYDTRKNEYNLKLDTAGTDHLISFNENIKGFSSFKSFTDMEAGISLNNNYYTFKDAELYKHHANETRANFYNTQYYPELTLILNADPYKNKRFKTILYEGTQAKVDLLDVTSDGSDADFYNIEAKTGWYIEDITTPTQSGNINEFLEKDSKWYNYIKGDATTASNIDTSDFNVQGLSIITSNTVSS